MSQGMADLQNSNCEAKRKCALQINFFAPEGVWCLHLQCSLDRRGHISYQFTEVSCIKKHFLPVILASSSGGWGLFLKKKNCKNQRLYLCIQFTATSGNLGHQNPSVRVRQGSRTTHLPPSTRDKNPTGIPLRRTEILVCSQGLPGLQCQTLALSFSPPTEEPWVSVLLILAARQIWTQSLLGCHKPQVGPRCDWKHVALVW